MPREKHWLREGTCREQWLPARLWQTPSVREIARQIANRSIARSVHAHTQFIRGFASCESLHQSSLAHQIFPQEPEHVTITGGARDQEQMRAFELPPPPNAGGRHPVPSSRLSPSHVSAPCPILKRGCTGTMGGREQVIFRGTIQRSRISCWRRERNPSPHTTNSPALARSDQPTRRASSHASPAPHPAPAPADCRGLAPEAGEARGCRRATRVGHGRATPGKRPEACMLAR